MNGMGDVTTQDEFCPLVVEAGNVLEIYQRKNVNIYGNKHVFLTTI